MECEDSKELQESSMVEVEEFCDSEVPQTRRPKNDCKVGKKLLHQINFSAHISNTNRIKKPTYSRNFPSRMRLNRDFAIFTNRERQIYGARSIDFDEKRISLNKREMSTIQEEVFFYKTRRNEFHSFKMKRAAAFDDKVASLKSAVDRLNKKGFPKPEVLENKLPDDVMKSFSNIQI